MTVLIEIGNSNSANKIKQRRRIAGGFDWVYRIVLIKENVDRGRERVCNNQIPQSIIIQIDTQNALRLKIFVVGYR